jgi:hypothetical protein
MAVTFMTSKDSRKAAHLIKVMEGAEQPIPDDLRRLASGGGGGGVDAN